MANFKQTTPETPLKDTDPVTGTATWGSPERSHPWACHSTETLWGRSQDGGAGSCRQGLTLTSDLSRCVLTDSTFR